MPTVMRTYNAHFTGAFVARCPRCDDICAYWDDDDLDENGNLLCYCDDNDLAVCDNCGSGEHTADQLAECVASMLGPPREEE